MVLWVIDTQPARRIGLETDPLVAAARAAGQEVIETYFDPSPDRLPRDLVPVFSSGRPLILSGSVGFAAWAHDNWGVRPGAFRSERLRPSAWLPAYGELALNVGAAVATLADFNAHRVNYEERFGPSLFVKPAEGGKLLAGTVVEAGVPLLDAHYSRHRRWPALQDDFLLLVAPVRPIHAEWRFVIAGTSIAARSQYKAADALEFHPGAPGGAEEVARCIAAHPWRPTEVFVADVAETDDGFRLIELNTFGTAGLYACDLGAVVRAVSPFAEDGDHPREDTDP
jgi:hypothetical protein